MQGEQREPELECELSAYLFVTCFGVLIDSFLFRLPLSLCRPRLTCVLELELELEQISEMLACQLIHHLCLVFFFLNLCLLSFGAEPYVGHYLLVFYMAI
jgi:hypothetical protein